MKKTIYIFYFLFIPLINFGQDSVTTNPKKIQFSLQAGVNYKTFLDNKYIKPTTHNSQDEFAKHQYERFNKIPTFGFSIGLAINIRLNQHLSFVSGLHYFYKKNIYENNQDTVIKYGNGSSIRDIHNVLKYDYTFNNIEIPLMMLYSRKKISLRFGMYISTLTYKKATYTYVINQFPKNPQWTTLDKTIAGFEMPLKVLPTVQMSYNMKIKKQIIKPYIALYYAIKNQNDFYIQLGINLPIQKKQYKK